MRYRLRLDGRGPFPDPASRFQPAGPHGPSMIVDPTEYEWGDTTWKGIAIEGQVIYEIHIGTFTRTGTFRSAIERLPDLVDTGITCIEVMPIAEFPGQFGWGYDGVDWFAPSHLYGTPDDFRAFIDAAHALEIGVILDVVYNHFGPDGNYLREFSSTYMGAQASEWGDSPNLDADGCAPVREFVRTNARYWIEEFHLDGLRLDATQQIFDRSERHIMAEIVEAVREGARGKKTIVVGENEPQDSKLVRDYKLDALWNDDFHHAAIVATTGRSEAYYSGYRGVAQEFVSAAKYGFLHQGQWFRWQKNRRGTPALDLPPTKFINFIQNHDQVANSGAGRRLQLETSPGRHRALTATLLLLPQTPMLFQGQDFGASTPFFYFADHKPELAVGVREGRTTFISQFPSIAANDKTARVHDPADPLVFLRSKLDWSERAEHTEALALHRDLLTLRREDPVIRVQRHRGLDGAVLGEHAFAIRFFGDAGDDRLLVVNFGGRLHFDPNAEPLLAPPRGLRWTEEFSTESPRYGGWGTPALENLDDGWWIPAEAAVLLIPTNDDTKTPR
jgi:maltooligosyltrehalose trehalohydrolase